MSTDRQVTQVIANTIFSILCAYFGTNKENSRKYFRVKNLTKGEIIEFLNVWECWSGEKHLQAVKVVVASDSDSDYPEKYKAEEDKPITWFRNRNEAGLIYLETKQESDEQGLKDIFTFQDKNFLDGYVSDVIDVKCCINQHAWSLFTQNTELKEPSFLFQQINELLELIHPHFIQIPVRRFINFVLKVLEERALITEVLDAEAQNKLIGKHLVDLNMFPDIDWAVTNNELRIKRRLELNLSHTQLITSSNKDIELQEIEQLSKTILFKDNAGAAYPEHDQKQWKELCVEYAKHNSKKVRKQIPYSIFNQLFDKDVKGLKLGERVYQEIATECQERLNEFNELNITENLNKKDAEAAQSLLEHNSESFEIPLFELLTKQTKNMLNKVAYPNPERFFNPLTKLVEISKTFEAISEESQELKIELRLSKSQKCDIPTIGLFSFLWASSLSSISFDTNGFEFSVDDKLMQQYQPPTITDDNDATPEDELILWEPISLEFALIDVVSGDEIYINSNYEWLPEFHMYFSLLWYRFTTEANNMFKQEFLISEDVHIENWVSNVCNRLVPFQGTELTSNSHPVIDDELEDTFQSFCSEVQKYGLSSESINGLIDKWNESLEKIKLDSLEAYEQGSLLHRDIVTSINSEQALMLPSHPTRLRWIAGYLNESKKLAQKALAYDLKLNEQNESLYLKWISTLSPHQQPPIIVNKSKDLLFASTERGWSEQYNKRSEKPSQDSFVDYSSLEEMASQVKCYLEAHPYKQDGLSILVILQNEAALPSELIKKVRRGELKSTKISLHVVAPKQIHDEIIKNFEELPLENRISFGNHLFPPLQLKLHSLSEDFSVVEHFKGYTFDISLAPNFLRNKLNQLHKTHSDTEIPGVFDPLMDKPTNVTSGMANGAISVSLIPRQPDSLLNHWSTLSVRYSRSGPVSEDAIDNTDYVVLQYNFQNTAKLFQELHECSHWVIILERYITREQVENLEPKPDILTIKDNIGANRLYTLVVSSNSGQEFILKRLNRKLARIFSQNEINGNNSTLAKQIYNQARVIAPKLVLQATGVSRVTEEILGLMVAMHLTNKYYSASPEEGVVVWISLDEHSSWFNGPNSTRADLCRICIERIKGELYLDVVIVEGKFRQSYDSHGETQVKQSLKLFQSIVGDDNDEQMDAELWREQLLSAMENVNPQSRQLYGETRKQVNENKYRLPSSIRADFRTGSFKLRSLNGLYSICCYESVDEIKNTYSDDKSVNIIKTSKKQLFELLLNTDVFPIENVDTFKSSNIELTEKNAVTEGAIQVESKPIDSNQHSFKSKYQIILDKYAVLGVEVFPPEDPNLQISEGPASVTFRLLPGKAVSPKKVSDKAEDIKLALELDEEQHIRFKSHKGKIELDVPKHPEERYFVDLEKMWKRFDKKESELEIPIGEDSLGEIVSINFSLQASPHLLLGGKSGSGKSEAMNTILDGIINFYKPEDVRLLLVDPKGVELDKYTESPYVEGEIGWEDTDAIKLLTMAVEEMENRYKRLRSLKTRSIQDFNNKAPASEKMPWWVIVLDEYGDLTIDKQSKAVIEPLLTRLSSKARAAGIHLIISTQKPSAEVISTNVKANLGAQLALTVKNAIESRVIIDEVGAETLNGMGDSLLKIQGKVTRVQCAKGN